MKHIQQPYSQSSTAIVPAGAYQDPFGHIIAANNKNQVPYSGRSSAQAANEVFPAKSLFDFQRAVIAALEVSASVFTQQYHPSARNLMNFVEETKSAQQLCHRTVLIFAQTARKVLDTFPDMKLAIEEDEVEMRRRVKLINYEGVRGGFYEKKINK